jgi:TPR repeat protein
MKYLLQSADHGEAESLFVLGAAHRDGWDGTIRAESIVAKWCALAAELGDQRPALVLGLLQKEGDRVLKDEAKALKWLNLAAVQGDNYARVILGEMLLEGDGVPADWRSGTEWIKKSAVAGFAPAQFRLGLICMVGDESTPRNEIDALAWFIVAAEAGSKPAEEYRDAQTRQLGREAARLAIRRSRSLLAKAQS